MPYDSRLDRPPIVEGVSCDKKTDLSLLFSRLELLAEPEKNWMTMFWEQNCSPEQIARMQGVSPSTMRRRIRHLTRRILDGRYVCFCRHREKFSFEQMAMAYDVFILGMGYRAIARKYGLELWPVRKRLIGLRVWLDKQNTDK